jgi:asparagine synthase (glutamine-hydrolysing)
MVTEVFGFLNIQDHAAASKKMADRVKYHVSYRWHETDVEEGRLGVVIIGESGEASVKIPLHQYEKLTICADISLYNKKELLSNLQLPINLNDTEILVHAFRKWGKNCCDYLTGDFAFAIWDSEKKELFCARDHMGMRPFFYTQTDGGFVFASELRMVKAIYGNNLSLNHNFLLDMLVTVISNKADTAFENIYRLPPAHRLIYCQGKITIEKYWQPDSGQRIRYRNDEEYIAHFFEILKNAVDIRCKGISDIGSELSGGLDSTAVTCIASQYADNNEIPFTAFSNTLPENHNTIMIDERAHILSVLDWKKIRWCEVNELKNNIPELIDHSIAVQGCFTQQRFHMFNKGIYEAAERSGIRVLLSGFGGDEMVSARTGNAWNDLIRGRQWEHFYQALRYNTFLPKAFLKGLKMLLMYHLKKNRNPGITSGIFTPLMLKRRLNNLPLHQQFFSDNQLGERYFNKHERKAEMFLADRQLQKIGHQHVPQRLEYSYAAAAYYGIQYRYPLFDIRLLQAVLSFPSWIKNRTGLDRYLFRQSLRGIIPESIRLRADKTGAVIPHTYLRLRKDKELIAGYLQKCSSDGYLNHIFDFSRFENWIEALLERNPDDMNYLMPGAFYNYLMIISWFDQSKTHI